MSYSCLLVLSVLVFAFAFGGILGALGFQRIGYLMTIPLAALLVLIASVPVADDIKDYLARADA